MPTQDDHIPAIEFIEHDSIDKLKWDACINESLHGLIYSTAFYLDTMAGKWDALICGDYEYVLPLPWKKKYGTSYIYPPAFTQQLGITSKHSIDGNLIVRFVNAIPTRFRLIEMNLQPTNEVAFNHTKRKNYVLPITSFLQMSKAISRSAKRNINKAKEAGITIIENEPAAHIIALHRDRFKDTIGADKKDYQHLEILLSAYQQNGTAFTFAAFNPEGKLIAGSIYLLFKDRLTFIFNGNSAESLQNGSTHLLMENTINHFANKNILLDFEGSDDPAFARFYEQYGASVVYYSFVKINRLPWLLRLFKP